MPIYFEGVEVDLIMHEHASTVICKPTNTHIHAGNIATPCYKPWEQDLNYRFRHMKNVFKICLIDLVHYTDTVKSCVSIAKYHLSTQCLCKLNSLISSTVQSQQWLPCGALQDSLRGL